MIVINTFNNVCYARTAVGFVAAIKAVIGPITDVTLRDAVASSSTLKLIVATS